MIVISDSTVLIGLAKIEKLELLQELFKKIYIPNAVFKEVAEGGNGKPGSELVKDSLWIIKKRVIDYTQVHLLMTALDRGEAEVLVLAKEMEADLILMDEEKARKSATIAGYNVMGVIGILLGSKRIGLITNIKTYIQKLENKKFRLSEKIINRSLKQAHEI